METSSTKKIAIVTCYDATFARICADAEGIDFLLVGDSLGMVIAGETSTTQVTMDDMLFHVRAVARGVKTSASKSLPRIIADMPIGSYESVDSVVLHAKKLMAAGASMVKVEGPVYESIRKLRAEKIPVCAHIGLTPQSILDYRVQGKTPEEASRLMTEARELELAGSEMIVLEMIPATLALRITKSLAIPTIGIGAGPDCSGQVLVLYDLLGFNPDFSPKFLKKFTGGYTWVKEALETYSKEVKSGEFPDQGHSFFSKAAQPS